MQADSQRLTTPQQLVLNVTAMLRPLRQWRSEHLPYRSHPTDIKTP